MILSTAHYNRLSGRISVRIINYCELMLVAYNNSTKQSSRIHYQKSTFLAIENVEVGIIFFCSVGNSTEISVPWENKSSSIYSKRAFLHYKTTTYQNDYKDNLQCLA